MLQPQMKTPPASPSEVTEKYALAVNLNCKIKAAAQLAQQSLYEMCSGFKKMRDDKLYKELGYSDFGDYCENEVGVTCRQVYNYIAIIEKLPSEFVNPSSQIGVKKLSLLANLSENERTEITQNNDLENTSVRELECQIKELRDKNTAAAQEKIALESKIKELENRPVETAVEYVEKIPDKYVTLEAYQKTVDNYNAQIEQADGEYIEMKRELSAEIDDLKKRIENGDPDAVFKLYYENAQRALIQFSKFVYENPVFKNKANELLAEYTKLIKGGAK